MKNICDILNLSSIIVVLLSQKLMTSFATLYLVLVDRTGAAPVAS